MCCICIKASSLIAASFVGLTVYASLRGDDLTGMPYDDPKELIPVSASPASPPPIGTISFLPMPNWSHGVMPALLVNLLPWEKDGYRYYVRASRTPTACSSEGCACRFETGHNREIQTSPAPDNPALMAVSPFLQWIKANPQAAATQAREQANSYHAASTPDVSSPTTGGGSAGTATGPTAPPPDAYWLPPLIDSPNITAGSVGGSSAAIYSTPQR